MVVSAAVVVGMIAVAYPTSIPVIGVVAAVVPLAGLAEAPTAAWP
jgi:hypothetical protein